MTLSTADRLEILDVIARADWAATRRDADAYVQLFTEDAVLDGDQADGAAGFGGADGADAVGVAPDGGCSLTLCAPARHGARVYAR